MRSFTKINPAENFRICNTLQTVEGAQWLSGRVLDSRPGVAGSSLTGVDCVVVLGQDIFILVYY